MTHQLDGEGGEGPAGDFEAFVRRHSARLRAIVAGMPRGGAEVDDLLQEALTRAYAKRHTFVSEQHAANWICHVVRCLLVDDQRSWYRRNVVTRADVPYDASLPGGDPADIVVTAEDCRLALRSLAALPERHRQLLWDHAVAGESYADIARRTATPLATVRSVAFRARAAARRAFRAAGGVGATVAVGLRRRLQPPPVPAEGIAACAIAFGLLLAGPAAAPPPGAGGAAHPPARVTLAGDPARRPAAERTPVPAGERPSRRPTTTSSPGATPGAPPGERPMMEEVRFGGDHSSRCSFTAHRASSALYRDYDYECAVTARSDECVALRDTVDLSCLVELVRGRLRGSVRFWAGSLHDSDAQCFAAHTDLPASVGVVHYLVAPGASPVRVPVQLTPSHKTVTMTGSVELGGRFLNVFAELPFPCRETVRGAGFRGQTHYGPRSIVDTPSLPATP